MQPVAVMSAAEPGGSCIRQVLAEVVTRLFPPLPAVGQKIRMTDHAAVISQSFAESGCRDFGCTHLTTPSSNGFRTQPILREGEIIGMRVRLREPEHLLHGLGLRDGDVVLSLNDIPIDGPEALSDIYREIRSDKILELIVERSGQRHVIRVKPAVIDDSLRGWK